MNVTRVLNKVNAVYALDGKALARACQLSRRFIPELRDGWRSREIRFYEESLDSDSLFTRDVILLFK